MTVPAALVSDWTMEALLRILGFGLYGAVVTLGIAFIYRAYSTRSMPAGPAVFIGVSFVAISLTAQTVLQTSVIGDTPLQHYASASYILGVFVGVAIASEVGRRIGDQFAADVYGIARFENRDEVGDLVASAGLVVNVELPETVETLDGYRAIEDAERRALSGKELQFPHRLSVGEIEDRMARRIEDDFDVDHVDVSMNAEYDVERFAVGNRPGGIGSTLPPGTAAVAVESDPAGDATTGDPIEVWAVGDSGNRLVATGVFRSKDGDVATVVVPEDDTAGFESDETYRLVTRPDTIDDVSEFVSVIWDAPETVSSVRVEADGPLEGEFVSWLSATALVLVRDGDVIGLPAENETLEAGDGLYLLGTPRELGSLTGERAAPADESTGEDAEEMTATA